MRRESRGLEWWISVVRLGAVPFAVLQLELTNHMTSTDRAVAWALTGVLALGGLAFLSTVGGAPGLVFSLTAMVFDFAIISAFVVLFAEQAGTPTRQLLLIAVVLAAIRFGMRGGVAGAVACTPVAAGFELRRSNVFHVPYRADYVTFQAGTGLIIALLVGWLVSRLASEQRQTRRRAEEAETLRDELGRRADLLDAANRCARALNSSLDLDEAFGAFIRELRGLIPFERMAIVLAEESYARVLATAGASADEVMPPGTLIGLEQNLLAEVVARGQTVVRNDMLLDPHYAEEQQLVALGVRSRVVAPLLSGARPIGLISLGRAEADAFSADEVELASLLGRLAASTIQNIHAYEAERRTVDELRKLSALRADFVSLVSHELRSPMAAVIGAARTLQTRWRDLQPEQRQAFLGLIEDETARLAALIGDVLDTSRIDAGTFSYRFADVDVAGLVQELVSAATIGQDEVQVHAEIDPLPPTRLRGDADRLRQVIRNLIDNAIKYSPAGGDVHVAVQPGADGVVISVRDRGPGISREDQQLIFEKFGRVTNGNSKPGTGLGLYIARSIAEAHGGTLAVESAPGRGSTFRLDLPSA